MYSYTGAWENETLEINILDIYPLYHAHGMDFDGKYDFDYNYALDNGYNLGDFRLGLIHSHCNTGVFFSSPDTEELKGNSENHPFYLSLITNNKNEWCGKVCIEHKKEVVESGNLTYRSTEGYLVSKAINQNKVVKEHIIFDCDIYYNTPEVAPDFSERVQEIIKQKPVPVIKKYTPQTYDYNALYKDAFSDIDSIEEDWDKEIDWFFNVEGNTLEELAVAGHYDGVIFGPEALFVFMDACQYHLTNDLKKDLMKGILKRLEHYDTLFAKNLKKDYERFIKKIAK